MAWGAAAQTGRLPEPSLVSWAPPAHLLPAIQSPVHRLCARALCTGSVHGLCAWALCTGSVHGQAGLALGAHCSLPFNPRCQSLPSWLDPGLPSSGLSQSLVLWTQTLSVWGSPLSGTSPPRPPGAVSIAVARTGKPAEGLLWEGVTAARPEHGLRLSAHVLWLADTWPCLQKGTPRSLPALCAEGKEGVPVNSQQCPRSPLGLCSEQAGSAGPALLLLLLRGGCASRM